MSATQWAHLSGLQLGIQLGSAVYKKCTDDLKNEEKMNSAALLFHDLI
jgi:hypothetical protein